jgi:tRNA(adenine34) deaminase
MEAQKTPPDPGHNMTHSDNLDFRWMALALAEAESAALRGEVPVGAVLVDGSGIIGAAGNSPISQCDPTAHAEILALRVAAMLRHNYRLPDATLYVTLEPCLMCMGALLHARVKRLVYGATDPKGGAAHSLYTVGDDPRLNHRIEVVGGVLAEECALLVKDFFRRRRENARSAPGAF